MRGRIILISTPIGNLADMSPRARAALESCTLLLCEDTRHTGKLLSHFNISVKLDSFHEHNEREKLEYVLRLIEEGKTIGIATDAGMPLLSDPGFPLMRAARERGITVEPIPGPFAGALALIASGLPPLPFAFFGFTPKKSGERQELYRTIRQKEMTAVVYESPHRINESLDDALTVLGDVPMTLAREMTKMHEEFIHGTISEVAAIVRQRETLPGEITLVFGVSPSTAVSEVTPDQLNSEFQELRNSGMRRPDAMKVLAERHGLNKRELYKLLGGFSDGSDAER